ncbi:Uncharacterized protein TCM_013791 [Theobroma cacao]|uniref:Uncharacterized protein n=1 Tax=Theobroma cacao TaxID=3641 RepID=A0A061FW23_THECC|nr:Uncharacterized protein TCM_013791 [Theobroma cacao]
MSSTLMLSVSTIEPNAKSKPFIITPNLRSILARLLGPTCQVLSHRHPWTELVDHTAFAKPAPFSNATSQVCSQNFHLLPTHLPHHTRGCADILTHLPSFITPNPVVITFGMPFLLHAVSFGSTGGRMRPNVLRQKNVANIGGINNSSDILDEQMDLFLNEQELSDFGLFSYIHGAYRRLLERAESGGVLCSNAAEDWLGGFAMRLDHCTADRVELWGGFLRSEASMGLVF